MEMAWTTNDEIMAHGEGMVDTSLNALDEREDDSTYVERDLNKLTNAGALTAMRYDEAEILQAKGVEVEWGEDLDYNKEKF